MDARDRFKQKFADAVEVICVLEQNLEEALQEKEDLARQLAAFNGHVEGEVVDSATS